MEGIDYIGDLEALLEYELHRRKSLHIQMSYLKKADEALVEAVRDALWALKNMENPNVAEILTAGLGKRETYLLEVRKAGEVHD